MLQVLSPLDFQYDLSWQLTESGMETLSMNRHMSWRKSSYLRAALP